MQQKNLQRLFEKDMTRREFLAHIGSAFLILFGIKALMNHLVGDSTTESGSGYGVSRYGR